MVVEAKVEIHADLKQRAAERMAINILSSDLAERLSRSSRILVAHEGRVTGDVPGRDADEDRRLKMVAGLHAAPTEIPARGKQP